MRSVGRNRRELSNRLSASGQVPGGRPGIDLLSDQQAVACFRATGRGAMHVQVWWQVDGGYVIAHSDDTPALAVCNTRIPPAVCVRFLRQKPGDRALGRLRTSKAWREYTDYFRQ